MTYVNVGGHHQPPKVAMTMYQSDPLPRVNPACCGPGALDRMSSRSAEELPLWTSSRYGTLWLSAPAAVQPGWPPVSTEATTSAPGRTELVGPTVGIPVVAFDTMAWSSFHQDGTPW